PHLPRPEAQHAGRGVDTEAPLPPWVSCSCRSGQARLVPQAAVSNAANSKLHFVGAGQQSLEGWRGRALASPLTAAKGTSVLLVLNQYKCIGCSPGKHPDTRTMARGSDDDSRDSVHDRRLCTAV